jgi:1,2-diacylglycerol 3-alpha-glucosyltransferase
MTTLRKSFLKGSPRKLIESAPGVDFTRFKPGVRDPAMLAEFGIPATVPLVVSFCRLIESKDVGFLLRAFSQPEMPPDAHLLILGKGPELESLRRQVDELQLTDRVHFAGFKNNVEDYLRLGHVYAFPSRLESFGLTLAQAMASGLPAVARRDRFPHIITSSASMIEDGKTGFLVDDEREMATALARILSETELRQRMASSAAEVARKQFCWDRHVAAIDAALLELAGR